MPTDTMFIIAVFCSTIILYAIFCAYNHKHQDNPAKSTKTSGKVQTIIGSWIIMLAVLFSCYLLGTATMALLIMFIGLKGCHEVVRLWKISKPYPYDFVLLGCVIAMTVTWQLLNHALTVDGNRGLLLFMIFLIQINDVNQYTTGTLFGHKLFKRKLAPSISPNKTIEGALFGSCATALWAIPVGGLLTTLSPLQSMLLAMPLAIAGIAGDLLQSAVKRHHDVKDMGNWIKGHGGIMDRVDSLLITVPIFYLVYILFIRS